MMDGGGGSCVAGCSEIVCLRELEDEMGSGGGGGGGGGGK